MKIAFPVEDINGLESVISEHFGRAKGFIIIDVRDGEVKEIQSIENIYFGDHEPGSVPMLLIRRGVEILACGGIGRRAIEYFNRYGVKVVAGLNGRVKDVLGEVISEYMDS